MLFVDLDGVLADFNAAYLAVAGEQADWTLEWGPARAANWEPINRTKMFYANLPLMPDALELWGYVARHEPIILTGIPSAGYGGVDMQKRAWVATHLGEGVGVITCPSKDKSLYCTPGDILIDDWGKYRHLWVGKGGVWITHRSAAETIQELQRMGL
jgi:hypothetical protein